MKLSTMLRQTAHSRTSVLSLLIVISILLALLIIPSWQKSQNDIIVAQISLTNNTITHLNELEVALQEMRAATRGYIITENAIFVAQFEQASERHRAALDLLIQNIDISRDSANRTLVGQLAQSVAEWRSRRLLAQISMVERGERDNAERDFLLGVSQQSYEQIRSVIGDIRTNTKLERRNQLARAAELSSQSTMTNQVLVFFALIGVGIVVVGFNRLSGLVDALQHSEQAAQHLSEELTIQLDQVNRQNARLAFAQKLALNATTTQPEGSRIQSLIEIIGHEFALPMVVLRMNHAGMHTYYAYCDSPHRIALEPYVKDPELLNHSATEIAVHRYGLQVQRTALMIGPRTLGTLFVIHQHPFALDSLIQQQLTLLLENIELFEQIAQEQKRLAMVVNSVPIGLLLIDINGVVLISNTKAIELFPFCQNGLPITQVISAQQFYMTGGRELIVDQLPIIQALEGNETHSVEIVHDVADQRIPVRHEVVSIRDDANRGAFVVILEDVRTQHELERLKADFVSMISHELRTPLAAIVGATSMLVNQHTYGRDQFHEFLQLINAQGQRLQKLIDDVLNVARIDREGVRLQRERIDPQLLVRRVVERQRPWASLTRVRVHTDLPDVFIDVLRIEQVLENLLENAVKYAPKSDIEVHLRYDPKQKAVNVSVRDFGTPLPESHRRRVFERFYQAHDTTNGGVGLGLAICKYFIEAHGGDIVMEAAPRDEGTMVIFTLPLTDQLETISLIKHGIAARVLVVDDDSSVQRTMQTMLQELEYTVVVASSVREAYERLDRMYFDLLIVDVMLPDQSGLDFVRDLRTWMSTPIMIVTARNSEKDVVAGLRAGVDDYMVKPFSYDEIALRVRNLLRRQHEHPHDDPSLRVGSVQLLLNSRQVRVHDELLDLTPIEHRLFVVFVRNLGHVLTHERLLHAVWGDRYEQENQYLWVHISHLRRKLVNALVTELHIENVRGVGYRMQLSQDIPTET
jgi:DNA-binding response OmpR family regulator/signal transduction histidine kinase/CHASE3 domain sensor protein